MTADLETDKETIRQVVRGERPWADLRALGMEVRLEGDRCIFRNPRNIEATADVHDLAKGFLTYRHDPLKLREWAFVLEASDVDFDLESHPDGEKLLDALWKASFGEPLGEDMDKLIEQLVNGAQSHS